MTYLKMKKRIGKMWTMAKLSELGNHGEQTGACVAISQEFEENMPNVAVHSAALAIDGVRLLAGSRLSLCGAVASKEPKSKSKENIPIESGFFYSNIKDIDDSVKAALVQMWSACCCNAIRCPVKTTSSEEDKERQDACSMWLEKLVPVSVHWCRGFTVCAHGSSTEKERAEVEFDCMYALGLTC